MFRKIILLLPLLLFSDEKILDVAIGSKSYGPMLITESSEGVFFDEEIEYGLCKSDNLSDLGDSCRIKNEKLIVKPKKDCLEKIELSFAKDRDSILSRSYF